MRGGNWRCKVHRDLRFLSGKASKWGDSRRSGWFNSRDIRLLVWRRGTDPLVAPVIFETKDGLGVGASVDRTVGDERVWFIEKPGFLDSKALAALRRAFFEFSQPPSSHRARWGRRSIAR